MVEAADQPGREEAMPSELNRCFCGATHCPYARAVAAQEVRQWARSKTPEERAAMAEECTRGVQRLLARLRAR